MVIKLERRDFLPKILLKQLLILNWKHYILLKRNFVGTIFELSLSVFFVVTLLIIRNIVERVYVPEQINPSYFLIDYFQTLSGHNLILFYPNNPLIERIVRNAVSIVRARKYWLNFSGSIQMIRII